MKVLELMTGIEILNAKNLENVNINFITDNTDNVKENTLFVCIKGQKIDGHTLKSKAKDNGAVCFVVQELDEKFNGVQILVKNTRQALAIICRNFYCHDGMPKVIGITGTNGKTTTTYMLKNILEQAGYSVGIIGTEGIKYLEKSESYNMTTPDPTILYSVLGNMKKNGVDFVVMEVSAHAIVLNKIDGIDFTVKALTNITQDHLDFFKTLKEYKKCKIGFLKSGNCFKVVNNDDFSGRELSQEDDKFFSYGIDNPSDVFAIVKSNDYSNFTINLFDDVLEINSKLVGKFNVENSLCASLIARLLNISNESIQRGLCNFNSVPGRLNLYEINGKKIIIDFAHTPDAFEKIMNTVRAFTNGRLICVFGCGGNRDMGKRPKMGAIATRLCDYVYITSDNPRYEESSSICEMIESGIKYKNYEIIIDRKNAIKSAYLSMENGDVLLILGKGAEKYMDIKGIKYPYEDKLVVESLGEL